MHYTWNPYFAESKLETSFGSFNMNAFWVILLSSKAESLLGTNKSSVRRFLSSLTDKKPNQNTEKAAEMFTAAATKWKIGQNFPDAAKSFEKAAECYVISDNPFGQVQV